MFRKLMLCAALALTPMLAACSGLGGPSPIVTAGTATDAATAAQKAINAINEKAIDALSISFDALDLAALSLKAGVETGAIRPNSPRALQLASLIDETRKVLNGAANARERFDDGDYLAAMASAAPLLVKLKKALL